MNTTLPVASSRITPGNITLRRSRGYGYSKVASAPLTLTDRMSICRAWSRYCTSSPVLALGLKSQMVHTPATWRRSRSTSSRSS